MSKEDNHHVVSFFDPSHESVSMEHGALLSEELDATNSPLLFGCRTGICGTCVIEVEGELPEPEEDEKELLEIYAPDNPKARLACQIELTNDIKVKPLNFD